MADVQVLHGDANGTANGSRKDDSHEQLLKDLETTDTLPLWAQMTRLNPPAPNPKCVPHVWRYNDIEPNLLRAGDLVSEKQAERRVLMLINPGRNEAPYTTDTLYSGLQLVLPNETAPAHRHVAFAARFIIKGSGGFTAVQGQRIQMQRGDVILTPTWNWHDHGKDGSGPMIWLDALDLPLFQHLPIHFVEHFREKRYPAENVDTSSSPIVFPWIRMKAKLDQGENAWTQERYTRKDERDISKTIGASAERLSPGATSPFRKETASFVFHVIEGSGYTNIDGKKYEWSQGDTFCVPTWMEFAHHASSEKPVYLYRFDDMPMMKSLGFYRTQEMDVEKIAEMS